MTSTPVVFLLKRSGISSDRPSGTILQGGEPALCFGAADPGLYFEDSAGSVRKIGPSAYGTTAPNASPAGLPGNSTGELWTDSSTSSYYLKVWTGSAWQKIGAAFADTASSATSANTANFAATATVASGAILASGAVTASSAAIASGAIVASGAILASGAIVASGAILASGAIETCAIVLSGLPAVASSVSGTLVYQVQSSGATPSGLFVRVLDGWAYTN